MTIRTSALRLRRNTRDWSLSHRALTLISDHHRWYDWGHRLMTLVGRWDGSGDYSEPRGRDLWYRFADGERGRIITTYRYADVRELPNGDWRVLDVQDGGGTVMFGWWGDRITFYGFSRAELALFRRWDFWECRARGEWFGIRRWLYFRGLHAAVHLKKPFACNLTPPRGTGGYSHWHCEVRGKHSVHRFGNYSWSATDQRVQYEGASR